MPKGLLWKFLLILAVVAMAAFFSYPPEERISLGLDLKGGAHIMMQVDTDTAITQQIETTQTRLASRLKDAGISYEAFLTPGPSTLALHGVAPDRSTEVNRILTEQLNGWDVAPAGSGSWTINMTPEMAGFFKTSAVDSALSIIRERLDGLGVSEPLVEKQGSEGDRILVQLPGVEDPQRVKELIKSAEKLEWKEVSYPPAVSRFDAWQPPDTEEAVKALFGGELPLDTELYAQDLSGIGGTGTILWPLKKVSTVEGADLRNAYRSSDDFGSPAVSFELTQDAGRRFEVATKENRGKRMAIILGTPSNKRVISVPVIQGVIRDQGIIQGGFSITDAEDLAMKLRSGAIPAEVHIIEERTVGPSLGLDSIRKGLTAGIVGFIGVLVFMVLYYRLSGINAVVALALNMLLIFGFLGALPFLFSGSSGLRATLTLPGIAGLILTVGMAVDSNVLIFERIREELRLGKTVRAAVDQGFGKAFLTILDCNVTTVVAAVFLGMYGTGPVRGFAVTLIIGLIASMFTAVFVSRQLFELVLSRGSRVESLSI